MKKAFISGVTGQDGAWLAKYLLDLGYEVYGGVRRTSTFNSWRMDFLGITDKVKLLEFDLLDFNNIFTVIKENQFDEFYNLAAQSFVGTSFKQPISTSLQDGLAVTYILDTIKTVSPQTKFYQASTSEMFGKVQQIPQTEETPLYPRSPYGVAKLYAHWMTINYQESYNLFACSGILFNHESELRGPEFVTRKITLNVASWAIGQGKTLELGNLNAQRDWGYAKEYVEGMHAMLQVEKPDFYVLATNKTTTIRKFVELAFSEIGRKIRWEGTEDEEKGYDENTQELLVSVNPVFYRPAEVELLIGDPKKAKEKLGWEPKTSVEELCKIMVQSDINIAKKNFNK
jgi:GDPmannose 4,6-dehydratase